MLHLTIQENGQLKWRFRNNFSVSLQRFRLFVSDNLRMEPKHIVFLSQLLLLFKFCHSCKADGPLVEARQVGTEVVVKTSCTNPKCTNKESTWHSQPKVPGWNLPAGNFLLSMAILVAGGSATKCFQIFQHMGLGCMSLNTFFKHQRVSCDLVIHHSTSLLMCEEKMRMVR